MAGMGQWAYNMGPPGQGGIYILRYVWGTHIHTSLTFAHTRSHSLICHGPIRSWAHLHIPALQTSVG